VLSLVCRWLLVQRAALRQGLVPSHILPHRWGMETVCGNTNLSPWWRNLCLSTGFYSVSSDPDVTQLSRASVWALPGCIKCVSHLWNLLSSLVSGAGHTFTS
uniref:Uncharacterized protein n=1 Tax=Sus scrofa TaxID=9823 RepID=A0A8W4FCH3_PIG